MITHLQRALVALLLTSSLPACSPAAPDSDADESSDAAASSAIAKDVGAEPPECGPCKPNSASPKGGYMECETATGAVRRVACTPATPPPPPPATAPCSEVRDGTSCHRVCCTLSGALRRCSALPCATSVVPITAIAIGGLAVKK